MFVLTHAGIPCCHCTGSDYEHFEQGNYFANYFPPLCLIPPMEQVTLEQLWIILVASDRCSVLWYAEMTQTLADQPWTIPQFFFPISPILSQEGG